MLVGASQLVQIRCCREASQLIPLCQQMIWKVTPACARFPGSRSPASPWGLCILVEQVLLTAPEFPCFLFLLPSFICCHHSRALPRFLVYLGLRVCFPFGPGVGGFHVSLCFAFCRNGTLVCCVSLCRFGRCRSRVQFRMPVFRTPRFFCWLAMDRRVMKMPPVTSQCKVGFAALVGAHIVIA